jgi:endonuclease III related protein
LKVSKSFPEPRVFKIYQILNNHYGSKHWWPGDTPFEIMVGAILTQNTAWNNVEKAIRNLKQNKVLNPKRITNLPISELSRLIRPSGFYNIKTKRLISFVSFLNKNYNSNIEKMRKQKLPELRLQLLDLYGIGEETADSILLYALEKPIFVVDAYTKRIFSRHEYLNAKTDYSLVQGFFMQNLPKSVKIYNEFHALLVKLAKDYCRTRPRCNICPIKNL